MFNNLKNVKIQEGTFTESKNGPGFGLVSLFKRVLKYLNVSYNDTCCNDSFTADGTDTEPTEWLSVQGPNLNKVFRLDGTENGKNMYTDTDNAVNRIFWNEIQWLLVEASIDGYYNLSDTTYPESGGWKNVANDSPVSISITRYQGTLQEVLEQISKPKEWPKVYRALLTQSGTDAPVATVLENTLGGDIVWTRSNVGSYTGTLANAFTQNKTFLSSSNGETLGDVTISNISIANSSQINLLTRIDAATMADIWYLNVEIIVYP